MAARSSASRRSGLLSKPTTVCPAPRSRSRMLPPILPSPTSPRSMRVPPVARRGWCRVERVKRVVRWSALQPQGHQQVAEVEVGVGALLGRARDRDRTGRLGEGEVAPRGVDHAEAVEQVAGVEPDRERSPVRCTGSDSEACASSPLPASSRTWSLSKASRTGVLRSATSETRRSDSTSAAVSTHTLVVGSEANSWRTRGNSPSSSRVVVRRAPPPTSPWKPIRPSAGAGSASATPTCGPDVSDFAVSLRTRAGISAWRVDVGAAGRPVELAQAGPEAVGGHQRDPRRRRSRPVRR